MPCWYRNSAASSTSTFAGERGDHGLHEALGAHFFQPTCAMSRAKHHGWSDDGVPVAEDERVDARILETEAYGVLIGGRRLTPGDIDRIAGRAEGAG